jgi:hypothetical protein
LFVVEGDGEGMDAALPLQDGFNPDRRQKDEIAPEIHWR